MSDASPNLPALPEWFTPERIDTVIVAFPDAYGRLLGKRMTWRYFTEHAQPAGMRLCNYLLTVDLEMNPLDGFDLASWEQGYGDFAGRVDPATLRRLPWHEKTALVICDVHHLDGRPVEESPRAVLRRQIERLAERGMTAQVGSELEFFLFHEGYRETRAKGYEGLARAADYLVDYHLLQPARDEDLMRRLRNEMTAAGIEVECSKGEWGAGQHEVNLAHAEALEMADRHVIYKAGAKDIAAQLDRCLTFMPKWSTQEAGSSCHLHTSLWDPAGSNLFWDAAAGAGSDVFRAFLGGLLKYGRELAYLFAPTVNAYKRYQSASWAPTGLAWATDNRTCGFRIVGHADAFRIENRMPGGDANPYLASAATIVAGLAGIDEGLDCAPAYQGNAYEDPSLTRLPASLDEAADLLEGSELAHQVFGPEVVKFYVHTARLEVRAFREAVTDWERYRYFEQI